jgi:hypothetical protein
MASKRPKKNRSNRDKQRARDRARRERRFQSYPLYYLQPPFKPYQEWIRVPDEARNLAEYPAGYLDDLPDVKDLADTLVKLGPRYHGMVPIAALHLEEQIREGSVAIAVTGRPGYCRQIPIAEIAADVSNPKFLEEMRRKYPEVALPETTRLMTDDAAAFTVHQLHAQGLLVMDDDLVLNLAIPPKRPGGKWILNGHETS